MSLLGSLNRIVLFKITALAIALAIIAWLLVDSVIQAQGPTNIIRNGDFELRRDDDSGVAQDWFPYANFGAAEFGWYDEQWPEAVRSGQYSQLMEIDDVYTDDEAVIAIHQTVDVRPNAEYDLTIHAILRSNFKFEDRNRGKYEMQWGVDPFGEGRHANVNQWVSMPLTEQSRIGSNETHPDELPLFYEVATGTIRTGPDNNRITLFIRGLKKDREAPEVNYNIDDVSLVGPIYRRPAGLPPTGGDSLLPVTGQRLGSLVSMGAFALAALGLVVSGTAATQNLLTAKPLGRSAESKAISTDDDQPDGPKE